MKYNKLIRFVSDDPQYFFENVKCPYCEKCQDNVYTLKPKCAVCGYAFIISEDGKVEAYLDPLSALGMKGCESKFLSEEISKVAQGRPGWKSVVATYHDPLQSNTFDIFWSMTGSNTLFKNGDRVDLTAASQEAQTSDLSNKTQYNYDPNMEKVETTTEIKSLINKYNLDEAGYSVSSFIISPDGNKVFSGAPMEAFDSTDATPFFSALEQCRALKASMAGRYTPDPDMDQENLQIAINNFIADDPMILSLPTGNITPDQVGQLSDFTASQEENMDGMGLEPGVVESHDEDLDLLVEEWGTKFDPKADGRGFEGGENWSASMENQQAVDFSDPILFYTLNGEDIPIYGSNHTGYRIQNQRNASGDVMPADSPYILDNNQIDAYVRGFVEYFFEIFTPDVYRITRDEKISFYFKLNEYMYPMVIDVQNYNGLEIIFATILPYKATKGNFDYIVVDYEIKNENIQRQSEPKQDKYELVRDLVNKNNIKAPPDMKGRKAKEWISKEYNRQLQKKLDELSR